MSAPNANKLFVAYEVGLWIRDLIKLHLEGAGELGPLKACRFGDLMNIPVNLVKDFVPGVFVKPLRIANSWGAVDGEDYISLYKYRIVYVAAIPTGSQIEIERMKGQRIADLIAANVGADNPTVPGVYQSEGIHCLVDEVNFEPEENDLVAAINADYYAVAVECTCQRHTFTDE